MPRVHGRVVVHETGAGVRDLTIVVLDVEREAVARVRPAALIGQPVTVLTLPGVRRLGSVLTDDGGRFNSDRAATDFDTKRNLMVVATAPDTPGEGGCPRIVHVSCDARVDAGAVEAFLVAIPAAALRDHGLSRLGLRAPVPGHDPVVEQVRRSWHEHEQPAAPISAMYRQRRNALAAPLDRRVPHGVRLAGGAVVAGAGAGAGQMSFDGGHWFLVRGEERSELTFAGAVSSADAGPDIRASGRLTVEIDAATRRFRLVVPPMAFHLREADAGPGALWRWRLAERSTATSEGDGPDA